MDLEELIYVQFNICKQDRNLYQWTPPLEYTSIRTYKYQTKVKMYGIDKCIINHNIVALFIVLYGRTSHFITC